MKSDPASLDNLRDIVEPAAVSWWPPATGWWGLLAVFLVVAAVHAVRAFRSWKANAYRRAALAQLQSVAGDAAIAEILKRTALAAFPRTDVASLSGDAWCQWLAEKSGLQISDSVRQCLSQGIYREADSGNQHQFKEFASSWIRAHKNQAEGGQR